MIDGTTGTAGLIITLIVIVICRYAYLHGYDNGFKEGVRKRYE